MDMIQDYLLRLTASAMICGAAIRLCGNPPVQRCVKLCCGICMLLIILSPIATIDPSAILRVFLNYDLDTEPILYEAELFTQTQLSDRISASTAAYILDKVPAASNLNVGVRTQKLSEYYCVPAMVTFYGEVDPALKLELTQILLDDLGLTEEQIQWIAE